MSLTIGSRRALLSSTRKRIYYYDDRYTTFTGAMAIRAKGTFYSPIIQGNWDGTGTPDIVSYPRGAHLANAVQHVYANFNPYQGTFVKWWTVETASADRAAGYSYIWYASADYYARYDYANSRFEFRAGGVTHTDAQAIVAGTTYLVTFSFDTKNTIDGTNYCRNGIDDTFTYGGTALTASAPDATIAIGSDGTTSPANALIEGLHVFNRVLFDGTYGIDVGNGDEIALIDAGTDPMIVTKGIGIVTGFPTDCGTELDSGDDHMWSWPRASNIPDVYDMWDGGLPGTPYAVEFNGTSTIIDCGSGATLDDLGDTAEFTVGIWFRLDGVDAATGLIGKGDYASVGWHAYYLEADNRVYFVVRLGGAATFCNVTALASLVDGKVHYAAVHYDDATKTSTVSIDGIWGAPHTGAGAYQSDAALNLIMGRRVSTSWYLEGATAWAAIWSDDHHVAGTDFIPPRTAPAPGGNLVESWHMDEGTGATAAAQVTSPANDGTITNGTWSSIWNVVGTPVVPQSIFVDGAANVDWRADCGSAADIDNLPQGANGIDVEFWFRMDTSGGATIGRIFDKRLWWISVSDSGQVGFFVDYDDTDSAAWTTSTWKDSIWHIGRATYDENGDRRTRLYVDGKLEATGPVTVGNYSDDSAQILWLGNYRFFLRAWGGALGPMRISNTVRETDTHVPVPRVDTVTNWALPDANTIRQFNMTDGAGNTITDTSAAGVDATITWGSGGDPRWLNTPDMTLDEPGARNNPNGYNVGSDGANDGIGTTEVVTAETDYAVFGLVNVGADGHGWPYLYIYDNDNAAQIGANYYLPRLTDLHTGANNSATLINANGHFTQHLVGCTLYNITDGSSTTITAVSGDGTTITGVLAGGTDNDWDTNDVYLIRFARHYSRHPFGVDFNFVFRTPAGCTSIDIEIRNEEGAGVIGVHSLQVLESLVDGGDMENGAGNPWIPTGYATGGLIAGESVADAVNMHAGAQCLQWNAVAAARSLSQTATIATGQYALAAYWARGLGISNFWLQAAGTNAAVLQNDPTLAFLYDRENLDRWHLIAGIYRNVSANMGNYLFKNGANIWRTDDHFLIEMDSVTITVTPANQANSLEGTGIRVDGLDDLQQGIGVGYFRASEGHFRFPITFRHDDADLAAFGNATPYLAQTNSVGGCYISVLSAANTITLTFDDGGGAHTANWATGGALAEDIKYTVDVIYTPSWMRLYIDNVQRIEITQPINFTSIPTIMFWGSDNAGASQIDAVIG